VALTGFIRKRDALHTEPFHSQTRMTYPETSIPFGALRHVGSGSVSEGSFERMVEVDGPAAPPVSASASKVTALPAALPVFTVLIKLAGGGSMELGTFSDRGIAMRASRQAMRAIRDAVDDWPILGGNYVRPDAVLAIEIVEPV
jgi:hypothetical protein